MPELPEVETIKNQLESKLKNKCLTSIEILDDKFIEKQKNLNLTFLVNQKLKEISRKGKYLLFYFETHGLLWHLGLTGGLVFVNKNFNTSYAKFLRLILHFEEEALGYFDIRKFGKLKTFEVAFPPKEVSCLGFDAYEISFEDFITVIKKVRKNLKGFLLSQRYVSGIGNIYADEILFRARLNPRRTTDSLSEEEILRLFKTIKDVLNEAIRLRGSSVKDYVDAEGNLGEFQTRHLVYGRKGLPCVICGIPLSYEKIFQRGTTFCKVCQK